MERKNLVSFRYLLTHHSLKRHHAKGAGAARDAREAGFPETPYHAAGDAAAGLALRIANLVKQAPAAPQHAV